MAKTQLIGQCEFCGKKLAKSGMTRHLQCCEERKNAIARLEKPHRRGNQILHLVVEGKYQTAYWLHVETRADSQLAALDDFLRDIWLECCGHMSEFMFPKAKAGRGSDGFGAMQQMLESILNGDFPMDDDDPNMNVRLGDRVKKGDEFFYDYDFGSTTKLKLRVVAERQGTLRKNVVNLLARNTPPVILCDCGKPAKYVCTECMWDDEGWLCEKCAGSHPCGDEFFLPVVNSPRCGVCAYTGE